MSFSFAIELATELSAEEVASRYASSTGHRSEEGLQWRYGALEVLSWDIDQEDSNDEYAGGRSFLVDDRQLEYFASQTLIGSFSRNAADREREETLVEQLCIRLRTDLGGTGLYTHTTTLQMAWVGDETWIDTTNGDDLYEMCSASLPSNSDVQLATARLS